MQLLLFLCDGMKKWSFLIPGTMLLFLAAACNESTTPSNVFDPVKQAAADEEKLQAWLTQRGLKDSVARTSSGLYYRIVKSLPDSVAAGPDSLIPNPAKKPVIARRRVFVRYEGRLLNDSLFDSNLKSATGFSFFPGEGSTIKAWEEGVLKFHQGDEGYLYAPSGLGYANINQSKIPANSCLVFFIRITGVE